MSRSLQGLRAVPRTVWTLGAVSLSMDVSSEMVHSLLPIFLASILGADISLIGLIEGVAEGASSIIKIFSGWFSDRLHHRKRLALAGYGLSALAKPIFPLATTPLQVFAAHFVDRLGKGIRGAPRDALVADITPAGSRGVAFGLRQALDTVGSFAGPLIAVGLMLLLHGDLRAVFAWAAAPAAIAVLLLAIGVKEPAEGAGAVKGERPVRWSEAAAIGSPFWSIVAVGVAFTLARFSDAFLVLKARDIGIAPAWVPLVMVLMNMVYAAVSTPAGSLSDHVDRRVLLGAGLGALVLADAVLASRRDLAGLLVGVALWGVHMGLTQGVWSAVVADAAPPRLRGTAFGVFNLAVGLAMLAASVLAGVLWSRFGPAATFAAGGAFASLAGVGLLVLTLRPRPG